MPALIPTASIRYGTRGKSKPLAMVFASRNGLPDVAERFSITGTDDKGRTIRLSFNDNTARQIAHLFERNR